MRLSAISQHRLLSLAPAPDVHLISIRSPGNQPAIVADGFGAVTYVAMSDRTAPEPDAVEQIAQAARRARDGEARRLVIQCEMGVSRSVGAARGIAAAMALPFDSDYPGSQRVMTAVVRALL